MNSQVRRLLTADPVVMWTGAGGSSYGLFPVPLQTWKCYQHDENSRVCFYFLINNWTLLYSLRVPLY